MRISDWSSDVCSSDLQIGPFALRPFGVFLQRACEAALEHLAHHREIVAGLRLGALDVELAIGALDPALRPRDDHRAQRIGALDMAVVIYLDALRRLVEIEQLGQLAPQLRLTAALREPPVELLAQIGRANV